jgi:HEAT repeat protein
VKKFLLPGVVAILVNGIAAAIVWQRGRVLEYQGKTVLQLCQQLGELEPEKKEEAARGLKSLGKRAVPDLVRLVDYQEPLLRRLARWLAPWMPSSLRSALAGKAVTPKEFLYPYWGARGIAALGPEASSAVPALGRVLNGTDAEVRWNAGAALGKIGPAAIPVLVKTVQDPVAPGRQAASAALVAIGPDPTLLPVLATASVDPDEYVRSSAGSALSAYGNRAWDFVTNALHSTNPASQLSAAKAATFVRPPRRTVEPRLMELAKSADFRVRRQAIETLGEYYWPKPDLIRLYLEALDEPAEEMRLTALKALAGAGRGATSAVPELERRMPELSKEGVELAKRVMRNCGIEGVETGTVK